MNLTKKRSVPKTVIPSTAVPSVIAPAGSSAGASHSQTRSRNIWRHLRDKHPGYTYPEFRAWCQRLLPCTCDFCFTQLTWSNFSVDHKIPLARDGGNDLLNMTLTCLPCNKAKGTLTWNEFRSLYRLFEHWEDRGKKELLARLKNSWRIYRRDYG